MASIYHDAERVIFWLGTPTVETDILMESLKSVQKKAVEHRTIRRQAQDPRWKTLWGVEDSELLRCHHLAGLQLLIQRPWFRRSWIVQEVCHAKTAVVVCGSKYVAAHVFALAPWLLGVTPVSHCQAILDMMPGASRSSRKFLSGREIRSLYSLILRFHDGEATEPLDTIYALLSMASDSDIPGFPKVDYNISFGDLIHATGAFLFPGFWKDSNKSHQYQSLSAFAKDLPAMQEDALKIATSELRLKSLARLNLSNDMDFSSMNKQWALAEAIKNGNARLVQLLMEFDDLDLNAASDMDLTPLASTPLVAAVTMRHYLIVKLLLGDNRTDVNKLSRGKTALSWAIATEDIEAVALLTGCLRVDQNLLDNDGATPLCSAIETNLGPIVKILLEAGADPNRPDANGLSPISLAIDGQRTHIVNTILECDKTKLDLICFGIRPLSRAARLGNGEIVRMLLKKGADVNFLNTDGSTPLISAVIANQPRIVTILLQTRMVEIKQRLRGRNCIMACR
jgi:ankyrin repeat protein